jgi:hypothetical protein
LLPVVEAGEDAERHAAMLLAANPANADLEHHVELLGRVSIKHFLFSRFSLGGWRVIGGSEGVVGYGHLVRSSTVVKMLIYRSCANNVVRGIEGPDILGPVLALSSL